MHLSHAVFALADRSLDTLSMMFSTTFVDFIRSIEKEWDTLIDAIASGQLPCFPNTEHIYHAIAPIFRGDADRAGELRKIGPPSQTASGWAKLVWPNLDLLCSVCTGGFGRVLPQVRGYLGSDVAIRNPTYTSTECTMGIAYDSDPLRHYKILTDNYIEFLEIMEDGEDGELRALWETQSGQLYEPFLTTRDGLWRYRTQDAVEVKGFSSADGAPVIEYQKRRNQSLRLSHTLITEADVMASVASIEKFDQAEFTTWLDDRIIPPTIGFFVELNIDNVNGAQLPTSTDLSTAPLIFADGTSEYRSSWPTVRIVAPGTFTGFRLWKGRVNGAGCSQVKVPTIMTDEKAQAFVLERVVMELE
ncbi:hypothetical protein CONPUDRAFT_45881 [Coniophora puteana RWD-64-598 SS2]|uniref:GH3 middle domain-containing protein n=1 Tax=Coniophora puteana (strain RWD-64-598) TaxID=741705 RepID=A0A5M3N3Y8_CONPW|nr:uncharacterized protein CONPUDRAFT_45881 [Coniophora puteana RWD-64-598 SS2]EIW86139.1 hypothetical protein CONPUDRAFT_45881 [Coniophora puteana RWD-64-598 SS2]